jgi:hypothetical protein
MSLVQVYLLRRKRAGENTDILNFALGATIKGNRRRTPQYGLEQNNRENASLFQTSTGCW